MLGLHQVDMYYQMHIGHEQKVRLRAIRLALEVFSWSELFGDFITQLLSSVLDEQESVVDSLQDIYQILPL